MLAKMLKAGRLIDKEVIKAEDMVVPRKFEVAIKATRSVTGYNSVKQVHGKYSNALKSGIVLRDLAFVVRDIYTCN